MTRKFVIDRDDVACLVDYGHAIASCAASQETANSKIVRPRETAELISFETHSPAETTREVEVLPGPLDFRGLLEMADEMPAARPRSSGLNRSRAAPGPWIC
jgi:hypothetical protein